MPVIKVSIKDKNTLELQEDAKKGDIIDLCGLTAADVSSVSEAVRTEAKREAVRELSEIRAKELEAELLKQERELSEKHGRRLLELEVDKEKYTLIAERQKAEIEKLKTEYERQLENEKKLRQIEIASSVAGMKNEILSLKSELDKKDGVLTVELERKNSAIKALEEQMKHQEETRALETKRVLDDIEREKEKLSEALCTKDTEYELREKTLKEQLESKIKEKEEQVAYYKDLKQKLNVKMLGETLEKHCDVAFEGIRGFLPANVEYGKDTIAVDGSLGDRIYREYDEDGKEVLSIMFEMKNEHDATATKKTNESFFKELDKDRTRKKCEYAVLVSLLERDNDIYDGIYTVAENKFRDMFVVRPQHFTQIIMWLRNVAGKLSVSRNQLQEIRQRDIDYTAFDAQAGLLRDKFFKHYTAAVSRHNDAVDYIDKTIKELQKIKDALAGSDRQLRLASEDLEDLTVKKLAKNSPGILEQIKKNKEESKKAVAEAKK
jgi:hypothetical protein